MTTPTDGLTREVADAGIAALVGKRVSSLQGQYLMGASSARAVAAHLRAAIHRPPGSVPAIWSITMAFEDDRGLPDVPTREETAVHLALCLWAIHQQSRGMPMHVPGRRLATSVADLARRNQSDLNTDPVRRRFDAVVTAAGLDETAHHLRGLITQLRGAGVPIDYGSLAEDLLDLQLPDRRDRVIRRWARQYHRSALPGESDNIKEMQE